jgi:hypothetical protein
VFIAIIWAAHQFAETIVSKALLIKFAWDSLFGTVLSILVAYNIVHITYNNHRSAVNSRDLALVLRLAIWRSTAVVQALPYFRIV